MRRARKLNLSSTLALDLCLVIMVAGFIGSRALHIFYEAWEYYKVNPVDVLKIWQGGFVFYGGFIAALLASLFFLWKKNLNFWRWADLFAPVIALGYGLGRMACFLNGCCYGKLCDLPWAIAYTHVGLPEGHRHPTQLYAVFWELSVLLILLFIEKGPIKTLSKFYKQKLGLLFLSWAFMHALGRLLMEHFRDDPRGASVFNQSIATWTSYGILILSLSLGAWVLMSKKKKL